MDIHAIERLLNSNKDILIQTNDLNELLKVVKRKLDYPYVLKQNLYPLSPFSNFLIENFDEAIFEEIKVSYSQDISDYFLRLINNQYCDVLDFFDEYFDLNEFFVKRNELYTLLSDYFIRLANKININPIVVCVEESCLFKATKSILKRIFKSKNRPRLIIVEKMFVGNQVEDYSSKIEKHTILFGSNNLKQTKNVKFNRKLFTKYYRWMCWEVCEEISNRMIKNYPDLVKDENLILRVSLSLVGSNKLDEAIDYLVDFIETVKDKRNFLKMSRLNRMLAYLYAVSQSRWELASNIAKKAYELAVMSGDTREIILAKSLLFFLGLLIGDELVELFYYLKDNEESFKKLYHYMSNFYYLYISIRDKVGISEVLEISKSSEKYLLDVRDNYKLLMHHHFVANVLVELGDFDGAIRHDLEAIRLGNKVDAPNISHIYNSLCHIYYTTGRFDKALDFGVLALKESIRENDIKEICMTLVNLAYIYMINNNYSLANEILELLMIIMSSANIQKLPIHSNVKLWVMDMYIKRGMGESSVFYGRILSVKDEEMKFLSNEDLAFYYWGLSMVTVDVKSKIEYLKKSLDFISRNEFKYVEVKILKDLIGVLQSNGMLEEAKDLENKFLKIRENNELYGKLLRTDSKVFKLKRLKFPKEVLVERARHHYQLVKLQSHKNELKFLNKIQEVLIKENNEEKLLTRITNIIRNSFLVEKVILVDVDKSKIISTHELSSYEESLINKIRTDGSLAKDILPYENKCIIPLLFTDGSVKAYLILVSSDQGHFLDEEQISILRICALLVSSKLEIFKNIENIERLAKIDSLTGVGNRVEIDNILINELERCRRVANYCFSIAIIDLDNFKYYNDTFGHIVGDMIIREFAKRLKSYVRKIDFVGRFGGDEFIVIMPHTNREQALNAVKRWFKLFETPFYNVVIQTDKSQAVVSCDKSLSMSVGVSDIIEANYDIERMFVLADQRMYISKRSSNKIN
ncbi:MAG: tetratricopeptide repeat-containing diguanylate cyclase [Spirochaetia bacterium]|nr:diguanylate cyclase [Spirochaetota bacterium]MDW8113145.1 tetratricopeptide repeat-containing diguanylate cyclase [Spirochaetia bacterium]